MCWQQSSYLRNTQRAQIFKGRYARLFVGLSDEKALWLASRHNSSGCFRHEMTFQDEASIRTQDILYNYTINILPEKYSSYTLL